MRVQFPLVLFLILTDAAAAQAVFDALRGQYGSAADPATSCAANPHQLDFMAQPPHALLTWAQPKPDGSGGLVTGERYDILDFDDRSLTLRLEGETRRTDGGGRPVWILRLTQAPPGYCWGRADWSVVRCEAAQLRCDSSIS